MTDDAPPGTPRLRAELRDLYDDYGSALDAMRLEDWTGYFIEGSTYRVMGRETHDRGLSHATIYCDSLEMIRDRAAAIRETAVFGPRFQRHFISGLSVTGVDADGDIAARANFLIIESMFDAEPRILLTGLYIDRIRRTDAGLKFVDRLAVYDNYRIPTTLILPV